MKNLHFKFKTFFFSLLIGSSGLSASQAMFEFKTGYFFFSDSKMRRIYDHGGLDVQLCASYPICNLNCRWTLDAYGAVEYFYRSGRSIHGHQKTEIWSVPVNVGLKPIYTIDCNKQYYFAVGPRYFYVHQHNHSSFVSKNHSRNGVGFFVNTGINYFLGNCYVIDIFGEYSYAKTRHIQVGGFTFGAGIGYAF